MDNIAESRIVSWIAYHCNKGQTLEQIHAINAKRRAQFTRESIDRLYPTACQAVRNAELLNWGVKAIRQARLLAREAGVEYSGCPEGKIRPCDIAGCRFPE